MSAWPDSRPADPLPVCACCGVNTVPVLADQSLVYCAPCMAEGGPMDQPNALREHAELAAIRRMLQFFGRRMLEQAALQTRWTVDEIQRERRRDGGY